MLPKLIGLTGQKGAGKSTVANHLVKNHEHVELAFANPIKKLIINLFNIDKKYVNDPELKETIIPELNVSGRRLMQVIGTELFREKLSSALPELKLDGESVWIHSVVKNIKVWLDEFPNCSIVVSDVRFDNEYEALKRLGFTIYKIERSTENKDAHLSERGCKYDVKVENKGTVEELLKKFTTEIQTSTR